MVVTAKAPHQQKTLDEAQLLLPKIGMVQWVSHLFEHSNPDDLDYIPNSKEAPNRPQIQRILLIGTPVSPFLQ